MRHVCNHAWRVLCSCFSKAFGDASIRTWIYRHATFFFLRLCAAGLNREGCGRKGVCMRETELQRYLCSNLKEAGLSTTLLVKRDVSVYTSDGKRFLADIAIEDSDGRGKRYAYFECKATVSLKKWIERYNAINDMIMDAVPVFLVAGKSEDDATAYQISHHGVRGECPLQEACKKLVEFLGFAREGVGTVSEYLRMVQITRNGFLGENHNRNTAQGHRLIFRGQANSAWELRPSLFRTYEKIRSTYYSGEECLIADAKRRFPAMFAKCKNNLDVLALMQHYEIPTRLLDVTENALVALYFASKEYEKKSNVDGKVFMIDVEAKELRDSLKMGQEDVDIGEWHRGSNVQKDAAPKLVRPPYLESRQRVQKCGFFIFKNREDGTMWKFDNHKVDEIDIPAKKKKDIRDELKQNCGIDQAVLFPESLADSRESILADVFE